jgi:hypothetical protein
MTNSSLSEDEEFHNTLLHFVTTLRVLAMDASSQCDVMASSGLAWEMKNDVLRLADAVRMAPDVYLSANERDAVGSMLAVVKTLSPEALRGEYEAVKHRDWERVRTAATQLLEDLGAAIKRNEYFFQGSN